MLHLQQIQLYHFRNYTNQQFNISSSIIGICGSNGSGKTNLLDAIYTLSFCKSYFSKPDAANVQHHLQGCRISGIFLVNNEPQTVNYIIRETGKKEVQLNGQDYKKLSNHIGKLPAVFIAPDDIVLVNGPSEERRKYLDTLISQTNLEYLENLIQHNKLLQQRNSLLKQKAETGFFDETLFSILTQQLIQKAQTIFTHRISCVKALIPLINTFYSQISNNKENIQLHYTSHLQQGNYQQVLESSFTKDCILQRTNCGIHKDDIEFLLNDFKFKTEASQGQKKSLLFACKLAEWEYLCQKKNAAPILILDDIFEKLDQQRMQNLLQIVCSQTQSQVFISDTHYERLQNTLQQLTTNFQLIQL